MRQIIIISFNTFLEIIRQGFFSIILFVFLGLIAASPAFTMFTLAESGKMVMDTGLASILLCSLLISGFSSSSSISSEIEGSTVQTVLSKPITRAGFIIGKSIGLLFSVLLSVYILSIVLIVTVRAGVLDAAWQRLDTTSMFVKLFGLFLSFLFACFVNYFYDKPFRSCLILSLAFFYTMGIIFLLFIGPDWNLAFARNLNLELVKACALIALSSLIISSVCLALSTRLNLVLTILISVSIFITGLVSDFILGEFASAPIFTFFYAIIPNFQIFWMADALIFEKTIPTIYIFNAFLYTVLYVCAAIIIGILLFEEREV